MSQDPSIPTAEERVLSTLNKDGSRRWLRPRHSPGAFLTARRIVGYGLIALFTVLPYVKINGKPPILLDIPDREFTFFGATFLPTDTLLLALLFLSVFVAIFLVTALFGRVWCGWACPQTVYMELIYRPIERLFEGANYRSGGRVPVNSARRVAKYVVYFIISLVLAHTFLAYFVGVDTLFEWVQRSPLRHPTAFIVMAVTTGLMMFDFCYLREQVCTLMCPYGRFQSVLLDRQSLIISYDEKRGEPRGKIARARGDLGEGAPQRGDCIDCHLCVITCPTGIDIREGLQMECVGCAQCIDACDTVMDKVGRPRGLIRYSSQEAMETGRRRVLRPRVVIYPVVLAVTLSLFGFALAGKATADVSFLHDRATPYSVLDHGDVATRLRIKITNRTEAQRVYGVAVAEDPRMTSSELPLTIPPGDTGSAMLRVVLGAEHFTRGRADLAIRVTDDAGFDRVYDQHVLGPLFIAKPPPADGARGAGAGSEERSP